MSEHTIAYPSKRAIIELNKMLVEHSGEKFKIDEQFIDRTLELAKQIGNELPFKEAIIHKAAHILYNLVVTQPFYEGNKRTALVIVRSFISLNGFELETPLQKTFQLLEGIVSGRIGLNDTIAWIKVHIVSEQ